MPLPRPVASLPCPTAYSTYARLVGRRLRGRRLLTISPRPAAPYRVALLSFDWKRGKDPRLSLGHASLRATLESRFRPEEVEVMDLVYNVRGCRDPAALVGQVCRSLLEYSVCRVER